ncbi:hypothetical protein Lal_00041218 [Lupinus albus]|nr:hypothetical protein Lal_00041218 [Lupinus albus]
MRIITRPAALIHNNPTRITRIRPTPEYPRARRNRLIRRRRHWSLKVSFVKRIRNCSRQKSCQINNHPVNSNVSVRRH